MLWLYHTKIHPLCCSCLQQNGTCCATDDRHPVLVQHLQQIRPPAEGWQSPPRFLQCPQLWRQTLFSLIQKPLALPDRVQRSLPTSRSHGKLSVRINSAQASSPMLYEVQM